MLGEMPGRGLPTKWLDDAPEVIMEYATWVLHVLYGKEIVDEHRDG